MADMGMQEAVRTVFGKYADFNGRARRQEYWWFTLFSLIISLVLNILTRAMAGSSLAMIFAVIAMIYGLGVLIPSIAVGVRRLHDMDKSGWWLLIAFVPIVGGLLLLYWFVQRGTVGPNQYGPDPVT